MTYHVVWWCGAGDLIQRWTNDTWRSNVHRVRNPSRGSEEAQRSRLSLVFFTGPMDTTVVTPIAVHFPPAEGEENERRWRPRFFLRC